MRSPEALQTQPALLDALYRQHAPALRRLCRRRLGNDRDAEDASQEALLRAWSSLDRYDPTRPMWPWLATIAVNVCTDIQRRAHTAESRNAPTDPAPLSPEEVALGGDDAVVVREALAQLSSSAQKVLFLRDVEGWSYSRIGRFEGRTPPAVRTAVTRARHQLRARVEALARARGGWPLAAIGLLWARVQRRARSARSAVSELGTRSTTLMDASTALLTSLSGTVAFQSMVGAMLAAAATGAGSPPREVHPVAATAVAADAGETPSPSAPSGGHVGVADDGQRAMPVKTDGATPVVPGLDLPSVVVPSVPAGPTLPPLPADVLPRLEPAPQLERPIPARLSTAASTPSSRHAAYEMPLRLL